MDNQQLLVTAEQIRAWCGRPDTVVPVRPVIDLNHAERIDAYHVPDRFRDHITLRDGHCRFPHCSRRAGLDADHIVAYADGGPTDTTNLAPPMPNPPHPQNQIGLDLPAHPARALPLDQPPRLDLPRRPHRQLPPHPTTPQSTEAPRCRPQRPSITPTTTAD